MTNRSYPCPAARPETWMCGAHEITDPYLWMENGADPAVQDWVAQENAYTDAWFDDARLNARVAALQASAGKPFYSGFSMCAGYLYAAKHDADGALSAVRMREDFTEEETLLDAEMTGRTMAVCGVKPCPADPQIAACWALKNGAARMSVIVRDLNTAQTLAELDGTFFFTWSSDGRYVYYSDAQQRQDGTTENRVLRWDRQTHALETVYTYAGHAVFALVEAAPDGAICVHIRLDYHDTVIVMVDASGEAVVLSQEKGVRYDYLGTLAGRHYFFTDKHAPRGKVVAVPCDAATLENAVEVVAQEARSLEGAGVVGDKLLLVYLKDVVSEAELYSAQGAFLSALQLPTEMGTLETARPMSGGALGSPVIYLTFESFTCPRCILRFDAGSMEMRTVYRAHTQGPREDIAVEQRFVTARDGQRILAFLVYKKGVTPTGCVPTLMYGYGGYAACMPPWYHNPFVGIDIPDWADKGGLYVHCILRGGGEYGAAWHQAGCGKNKKNVFCDFIDITKQVIQDGWTDPAHIAICGGSNGGLLVTALLTMEPELFACAIASVPHTDMLRFSHDDRGPMYVTEYGDPRTEALFTYMQSYSPYHNVRAGVRYPATYVQTGELDNNVPPYHGKKFAAKLQQSSAGGPVLLRVLPYGSHDRGEGKYFSQTTAEMQIFIEQALGMQP